ncbi:MAG: hypothetical protein ACXVSX_09585 [Solirubrobacteraceae bacterium]
MRRTVPLTIVVVAALAAPPVAGAQQGSAGSGLGPATAAALRSVPKARTTRGALNPGRAATVLARIFRAAGDHPRQVACAMVARDTAACLISVDRGGAPWTGVGKVWQGRHAFRASYEISTGS